jgi:hypothetical protein
MSAHPVDHDQERRLVRDCDGDAVLIVLAIPYETEICMLDPQALQAPAGRPSTVTLREEGTSDASGVADSLHRAALYSTAPRDSVSQRLP